MFRLLRFVSISVFILIVAAVSGLAAAVADRGFGTNGVVTTEMNFQPTVRKLLVQPDGKIVAVGDASPVTGAPRDLALARYNADGSPDVSFGVGGRVFISISADNDLVKSAVIQPDGKFIVVGSMQPTPGSSNTDFLVVRINSNGSLDSQFGNLGIVTLNQGSNDVFNAVTIQPDGKIVAVGKTSDGDKAAVFRFSQTGAVDAGFANGGGLLFESGNSVDDTFLAVANYPNGRILIGGTAFDGLGVDLLVMLEANGSFSPGFGNNGVVRDYSDRGPGQDFDLTVQPDGKMVAVSRLALRRRMPNGAFDNGFRNLYNNGVAEPYTSGTALGVRSDGRIIVLNQVSFSRTDTAVYASDGREIAREKGLGGSALAVQSDDKFIIAASTATSFRLTRYLSITSAGTRIADIDNDAKSDFIVSRGGQTVYALRSTLGPQTFTFAGGAGTSLRFIPEDFAVDTPDRTPFTAWRSGAPNSPATYERLSPFGSLTSFPWGISGDIPVGGDYDGEANNFSLPTFRRSGEPAVFRPSTGEWWVKTQTPFAVRWGTSGDKPVPADYDYDGKTDFAVYRPSTGTWWILRSSDNSYFTIPFGIATDTPLTGDFDGDGRADFTVFRASEGNWYQLLTTEGYRVVRFGLSTDSPVPGDYDGDGRTDIAVFRAGLWYILESTNGFRVVNWGTAGDTPIAVRYDQ